jgi:predicted RNase H-like HicB family nuclease
MYVEAVNQATNLTLKLRVIIEPDEDRFHAYCPAFKGLHVDGANEEEALNNAGEAAIAYLNSLAANHEAIPIGPDCHVQEQEQIPEVPADALLKYVELSWPSRNKFGIS